MSICTQPVCFPSSQFFQLFNDIVSQDDKTNYTDIFFKTSGICIRMIGFLIQVLKHIYFGFCWNVYYLSRDCSLFFGLFKETEDLICRWHLSRPCLTSFSSVSYQARPGSSLRQVLHLFESLLLVIQSFIPVQQRHATLINYLASCPRDRACSQARMSLILGDFRGSMGNSFFFPGVPFELSAARLHRVAFPIKPHLFFKLKNSSVFLAL